MTRKYNTIHDPGPHGWNSLTDHDKHHLALKLTARQLDVYKLRLAGLSWDNIAWALNLSIRTCRTHGKRAEQIHAQLEEHAA